MSKRWRKAKRVVAAKRDDPRPFRFLCDHPCEIEGAKKDGELPTFKGVAYTGAPMKPGGWWRPVIIDLAGVRSPSQRPVLRQHDHEKVVGHTTEVKVGKEGVLIAGVFSGEKHHVDTVVVPARNKFPWQLSVGADPVRTEFLEAGETTTVNGREVTGPMTISRETEIGEISFVPLGADDETSVAVAAQKGDPMNPFALALKQLMARPPRPPTRPRRTPTSRWPP